MKYCTKCVMPSTRPGITFDENGVCSACQSYDNRKNVDYKKRWQELENLCDKYRNKKGQSGYDCVIAVSGGKDSHFQTYIMKEKLKMNPLLVSVEDNFPMTNAGRHNLKNISEAFGCDIISIKPNIDAQKKIGRYTFEKYGKPTYLIDRYIYSYPLHMAVKFNIPLLVYGENVAYEYGGENAIETYSAKDQIKNGVGSGIEVDELLKIGIKKESLNFFNPPSKKELDKIDPIYISYFVEWNSFDNYSIAKRHGFHDLIGEWDRTHCVESIDQVETPGYLVHAWMKYPKFGHASATDYASRMIRYGMITRDEAVKLVKHHDHALDNRSVREFCDFFGYSEREFWHIVDKHYNQEIFKQLDNGSWKLKNNIE
ncbi:N-acetyl sugar amidotransferase [Campylobacter mucosalis]|uniref:N-acetyl sugar amidotransferase n=1 Tax=Campylobacter mucosalis TaxID=202 RepID=UPI0004D3EEA3|nr:N-acetyl sugar amidotransferase [Campylobacter mucosalis]KEA45834.1 N-acetyl sugar amidotransferase [Campylobacter mucosalis]QKF62361.1 N-acetyl sugar amidotransferase [Campylobacter mucosalis]